MKTISRNKCIMCGTQLENKHTIKQFPVYMGVAAKQEDLLYSDKQFCYCPNCKSVQLGKLIPLSILYQKNHNSAIGKVWQKHHNDFCSFIENFIHGEVLEIGGGNLKVANFLSKLDNINNITVFDKSFPFERESDKITLKKGFFDVAKIDKQPDTIIHTHLIEHLYDPLREMKEICDVLPEGGLMMFAAPLIDEMLRDNYTNAINFEHTFIICEKMIENIMSYSSMKIIAKKYFSKHAAFFIAKKETSVSEKINHSYPEHLKCFQGFYNYHIDEVKRIKSLLLNENNAFIFGAHIFTQYLLAFGLQEDTFLNVLDNDPDKQGHTLYGTELVVKSPKILKNVENPLVVLKAAMYTDEIKNDILQNINSNTRFIL